ncbi:hypothetical protein CONLIGDRAFT_354403 [Coniochaeta ligniaria NRRL 30616]|uniref:2EXR domain-containing protein n=1 Tax=Coniochaeta ligniaria NRRL 30616 TaxID=1408157 RepID=A0A1J7IQS2_9PEZI|nr:hypothetical protein CONLIGDRAFT_354403 [Coniochaeta ligniaria NRRL 30616]
MSASEPLVFALFPKLPTELRFEIWRLCLPHRVLEVDYPVDACPLDFRKSSQLLGTHHEVIHHNMRLPVIARVSRESRQVVFETWTKLALASQYTDALSFSNGWNAQQEPWFDRIRTSFVHLGWTLTSPGYEPLFTSDAMYHLQWAAAQTDHARFSIALGFLREYSFYSGERLWERNRLADTMRQKLAWVVVIDRFVIVRTDVKTAAASDLFGLLADSRVQIVEADDEAQMARFLALVDVPGVTLSLTRRKDIYSECQYCNKPEDTFSSTILQEAIQTSKAEVSGVLRGGLFDSWRFFEPEEHAPRFHMAVMFRLYTEMGGTGD